MFVPTAKMRGSFCVIAKELQILKLRHRNLQCFPDSTEASVACFFRRASDLLEKIRSKWILAAPDIAIRLPEQLGNEMKITDSAKKIRELPELTVDVDLLDVSLMKSCRIALVFGTGTTQHLFARTSDDLALDHGALPIVLAEAELIFPIRRLPTAHGDSDLDIRIAPGGEASQSGNASSFGNGFFETSTQRHEIVQETKRVEKIGFP